jgi:uncharacterized protein YbjQ (UPF0145 family)
MIVTTTPNLEGKRIIRYLGIVSGESIFGANFVRDFMASITDIVGGRSAAYEEELRKAKDTAMREMTEMGQKMGANAILSVDLDYETIGESMLMVTAAGTAVVYQD